jgi:general secretion pathway protein N
MSRLLRLRSLSRPAPATAARGRAAAGGSHSFSARQGRTRRWAITGALVGALLALIVAAPARWLAAALQSATDGHLQLADAQGSIWSGDAVLVLTAGSGAREARALPGRIAWTLAPAGWGLGLRLGLRHDCCLNGEWVARLKPGFGSLTAVIEPGAANGQAASRDWLGAWPAALLVGLGTPWNTLQPGGALRVVPQGLSLEWVRGRFAMHGRLDVELRDFSSRLATLPRLGSYRFSVIGDAQAGSARVELATLDGALQLSGSGSWSASGLRLRGEATAAEADQAALNNLLNIIGRREGARSLLSIG